MSEQIRGTLHVFTYKTGVLAKAAHDLRLSLTEFSVTLEGDRLLARFASDGLRVDGVMAHGALDPGGLSAGDKAKVEKTTREEILASTRYPEITLEGRVQTEGARHVVEGTLTIRGRSAPVFVEGAERQGRVTGSVDLSPSRWGIAPYKALFGAIQLQDRVTVVFEVPAPGA